tara:strand:- start:1265 stop:1945 length:681 start_codon:yes stop_codon:yes gene_type:complete
MFFPNKTIFVHIPKTGGSSLEFAISKKYYQEQNKKRNNQEAYKDFLSNNGLSGIDEKRKIEEMSYNNFTINGFFRDLKKGKGGHPHSFISDYDEFFDLSKYEKFVVLRNPFDQVVSLYNQMRKQVEIKSLDDFVMCKSLHNIEKYRHYIDQYAFTHIDGILAVDRVFVFDRYSEAQDYVEETYNLKIDRSLRLWKTEYSGELFSKSSKRYFEGMYHQSIDLYNSYL